MSKNHRFHLSSLVLLVLMILGLSVVAAQNSLDEQPLLKMLANVPDNATSRSEIMFNDRKAIEVAYPSAKMPVDWAEFSAMSDAGGENKSLIPVDIWWRVWRNQQSSSMSQNMFVPNKMVDAVGFDFFTVEQELRYGQPPMQTLQINGPFDLVKVRSTLTAHGYTQQDQSGVEVWCSSDGCDTGAKLNINDRNLANPFGGDLGRKWPIIFQPNTLIGSPDLSVIQNHVAVKKGGLKSLADAPEYRAAADALTQNGVLMQAYFWDGTMLEFLSQLDPIIGTITPARRKAIIADMLKDYETLPVYKLLAFGDIANDTQMSGETALVYSTEEDAKRAAAILPNRIANYMSLATKRPLAQILTDSGVTQPDIQVVESNGQYVVLVSFASAKNSIEDILAIKAVEDGGTKHIVLPGAMYRTLVGSAMRRDLGWLSTIPRELLEAAAK